MERRRFVDDFIAVARVQVRAILLLLARRVLLNLVLDLAMDLVANALEVIHRDEAEQRVLARQGLLLARGGVHLRVGARLVHRPIRVKGEGARKSARGEVVASRGRSRLAPTESDAPREVLLLALLQLICLDVLRGDALLGHHRVIRIAKVVQVDHLLLALEVAEAGLLVR